MTRWRPGAVDSVALAQAWSLEFDPVGTLDDVTQNGVADRVVAEHFGMPQRLTGESLGFGLLTHTIPCTASAFRSVTDARVGDRG
jgi:hypothetical protein